MADEFGTPTPTPENRTTSTPDVAREQAAGVGRSAADAGRHVTGVAGEQASQVVSEAAGQARDLYRQGRDELSSQAAVQQERLAEQIHSVSRELASMADRSEPGLTTDLVRDVSGRADALAGWLDRRDPGGLVRELTTFARRRPGTFLAVAAGAGLVTGRLTRGAAGAAHEDEKPSQKVTPVQPAVSDPTPYESYERYEAEETAYRETTSGRAGL